MEQAADIAAVGAGGVGSPVVDRRYLQYVVYLAVSIGFGLLEMGQPYSYSSAGPTHVSSSHFLPWRSRLARAPS